MAPRNDLSGLRIGAPSIMFSAAHARDGGAELALVLPSQDGWCGAVPGSTGGSGAHNDARAGHRPRAACRRVSQPGARTGRVAGARRARRWLRPVRPAGAEIYLHCPTGFARTKLTNNAVEKALAARATSRNWNTVTKLAAMAAE